MIICGENPVLLDSYCARLIGYDAGDIEYIKIAEQLGLGRIYGADTKTLELNADNKPVLSEAARGLAKRLSAHINENGACSACYSALISALNRAGHYRGEKICVGQGFRGKSGGFGCGNCASGFDKYVKGCPPSASEILGYLRKESCQ
jgi:hypothetical protein